MPWSEAEQGSQSPITCLLAYIQLGYNPHLNVPLRPRSLPPCLFLNYPLLWSIYFLETPNRVRLVLNLNELLQDQQQNLIGLLVVRGSWEYQ